VTPFRLVDTRTGATVPATYAGQTLAAASTLNVQVTGLGTVPAGATAAVLNVAAIDPTASGFLTVFAEGTTMPTVSNLNFTSGEILANLVTVPLSASGGISIFNHAGSTDILVDVEGYYTSTAVGGLYNAVSPVRVLGTLALGAPVAANTSVPVTVTGGATGVPSTATAVVLSATADFGTSPSFLTVYPAGVTMPTVSNVNFTAGEAVANRVTIGIGTAGQIEVYNHTGTVNVDIDVDGYYASSGSVFVPITPVRVADTRTASLVGTETPIGANASESFNLATAASGIPAAATSVAANFTVVAGATSGYLSIYPTTTTVHPVSSSVNWVANWIVPAFTIADTAGTGSVEVYNSYGTINLVVDDFGYFIAPTVPTTGLNITVPSTALAVGASLVANGLVTNFDTVTATVTDGAGGAAVVGDTVLFTATPSVSGDTCGTFSATTFATIAGGVATVKYFAPLWSSTLTPPYCTITAQDATYGQTGSGTIANTEPGNTVAVVAASPTVPALATSTDVVTATVAAATAGSAANDTVSFAVSGTGCGTVSPISGNTGPGDAAVSATYTAGTTVGFCTVTATESINGASGTVTIAQSTPVAIFPPTVSFSPALASVAVSTTNTNLFTVTVGNPGAVVSDPLSVAVTGAACSGATAVLTSPVTNASGQDTVTYTASATTPAACTVTVKEADAGSSGAAVVTQTNPVTSVTVSASPLVVAHGTGTANITVTVTNPVAGDIGVPMVYSVAALGVFSVPGTCGTVASVTPLSSGGIAYATYTAGTGIGGFCTITAKTAVSLASGTVNVDQV
jgi:hypothetical protein